MKYPPGTKVLLKSLEEVKKITETLRRRYLSVSVTTFMESFCGTVVTIDNKKADGAYHFTIVGGRDCGWRNEWVKRKVDLEIDEDGNIL